VRTPQRGFASDNSATIHPEVLGAIAAANAGHAFGYGHDGYSEGVVDRFREHFGADARAFFVFNGSAANVLSLRACCKPWQAAICAATAHLNVDECGAPEAIAGVKLLSVPTPDGKLTAELVWRRIERIADEHAVQPGVVTISQCTELGTLYTVEEIGALASLAHEHGLRLHVDGARLSNAAAALGVSFAEMTSGAGVDIVSFGGTKNGLLGGEAVVILTPELAEGFQYIRKQSLQLASKMRFIAAQFDALLTNELWLRNARQANAMAARLEAAVASLPGVRIAYPVQTNAVFAGIPRAARDKLIPDWAFYDWDVAAGEVRWMCSWDTTEEDVDTFAGAVADALR
jgi:threonine aldolase